MRIAGTLLVLASFLAAAAPVGASAPPRTCQRAIARAGGKLAKTGLKAYQHCALRTMRGTLAEANCRPAHGAATGDSGTDGAIAAAVRRLSAAVEHACGGADVSAFAARCGAVQGVPFTLSSLILCLRTTHLDRASAMAAVEFPESAPRAAAVETCGQGETCTCHCSASPSGAFVDADAGGPVLTGRP